MIINFCAIIIGLTITTLVYSDGGNDRNFEDEDDLYRTPLDRMWRQGKDPMDYYDKTYYLIPNAINDWSSAAYNCYTQKLSIASIRSETDNEKLLDLLNNSRLNETHFWTGGNQFGQMNPYKWYPGYRLLNFTYWLENEPNISKLIDPYEERACVAILPASKNRRWSVEECDTENSIICEDLPKYKTESIRNKEYIFGQIEVAAQDAIRECRLLGGYLVSINSDEEATEISWNIRSDKRLNGKKFWVYRTPLTMKYYPTYTKAVQFWYDNLQNVVEKRYYYPSPKIDISKIFNYVICERLI